MRRVKLGLIQTNRDRSSIGDLFADDSHRFRDLFDQLQTRFSYRVYMAVGGEVPEDPAAQDAWLITGSPLSVLDDLPWLPPLFDFVRACDALKRPLIGACFGHQAIALALGAKVRRGSWNIGIEEMAFSGPLARPGPVAMHMFHHDYVMGLPPGCDLAGVSRGCSVAGLSKGRHLLTTQAHPEFTDRFMRAVLAETPLPEAEREGIGESLRGGATQGLRFAEMAERMILEAL